MDDTTLTTHGLTAKTGGRILLLACGALAREILDLIKINRWDHMDLHCLPAILHVYPDRIPDAVDQAITKHRAAYDDIFVVYADCGTGGLLQQVCDAHDVKMVAGPHCYSFFEGNTAFAAQDEVTAFYLTDFLVRQFDAFVIKPLGLDRHPDLRDMYFGNYTKLVYQSQTKDEGLIALAQTHAARLGLAFEHRHTGYGDLATALSDQA
ncbi:DUF1638 domain-containing protein [Pseudooctadecabacter jejudonensis]|uniref:DUF1638 domain-containing protein n=1 Tax=Pseudooctadecabacter jejudonensis TaxID=1391910 RepID=A0A1Y5R7D3_9RHOB|nr:DUF1638 domain-containing protein [Pseudooctadecabacter jejudonensis]SLN10851.1 hypothetical protein PSJ8397_00056 [Pseudooctadecabacter jejudonensis]